MMKEKIAIKTSVEISFVFACFCYLIGQNSYSVGIILETFILSYRDDLRLICLFQTWSSNCIYNYHKDFKLREAVLVHDKMTKRNFEISGWDADVDYVDVLKTEMNKTLNMGPLNKPQTTTYRY